MAENVTTMRLKVDLQCEKCYKKVNKVLCKFPREIREQVFDEKKNIVTIKVVCCSPEKMRDKLCCKGCGAIKSIEIVPPKPLPPQQPPPTPPRSPITPPPPLPLPPQPPPRPTCCGPCSRGRAGGPCFERYCRPPPYYEGYFIARPVYDSYGGGRPCYYVSRCDQYFNEDNATGCTIM